MVMCVCVTVCVFHSERERERECVFVCVCVCVCGWVGEVTVYNNIYTVYGGLHWNSLLISTSVSWVMWPN